MKTSAEGFQQCYNAQTVVDAERQIIVAVHLGSAATDQGFMLPLLDGVEETFGVKPGAVLADAGYCNEEDLATLEERGIDGYVALGREGKERVDVDSRRRFRRRIAWARSSPARKVGACMRSASGSRRRPTDGSRRYWASDASASGVWKRCVPSGTWSAWR